MDAADRADYAWPHFKKATARWGGWHAIERRETSFVVWELKGSVTTAENGYPIYGIGYRSSIPDMTFMGVPVLFLEVDVMSDNVLK